MEEAERGGEGETDTAPPVTLLYTYRDHMTGEQDALITRAKQGFRICKGLTVFFQQAAVIEDNYGTALVKVGERFMGLQETCAPSLSAAVACLCSSIQTLGRQHTVLASTLNQDIIKGLKLFSEQQKETVRKLALDIQSITDETQRARATHRKAQDKYRRCLKDAEAVVKLIGEYKDSSTNPDTQACLSSSGGGLQALPLKAELHRADSLFSKWLGGSMARAQDRAQELRAAQEDFLGAQKLLEAKEAEMKQRLGEQLEKFEANEEARGRYLKETFKKLQSCRKAMLERVERAVKNLLAAACQINPEADLCEYIQQVESTPGLSQEGVVDMEAEDARLLKAAPPALMHIDRSIKNLRGLCSLLSELAAVEESYGKAYTKLLNGSGYRQDERASPTSTVNWAKTSLKEVVDAEGGTFAAAISAYMHNDRYMARLHTATASRLAQSVCVILSQLQDELTQARQSLGAGHTAAIKAYQTAAKGALLKARAKGGAKAVEEGKGTANNSNGNNEMKSGVTGIEQGIEATVPTLEEQRENLAAELESLQVELRKREDERLGRMKVGLMELYQALNMEYLCCVQEEERTRAMVDSIDVHADVMGFIRATIEVEENGASAAAPTTTVTTISESVQQEGSALLSQLESLVKLVAGEESSDTSASGSGSGSTGKTGPGRLVASGGVFARRAKSLDGSSVMVDDASTSDLMRRTRGESRCGSLASMDFSLGADDGEDEDDQGTSVEDEADEEVSAAVPSDTRTSVGSPLRRDDSGESRVRQVLPDLTSPRVPVGFKDKPDQPLPSREHETGPIGLSKSVGASQGLGLDIPMSPVAATQAPTTASSDALPAASQSVNPGLEISTSATVSYSTPAKTTPPFGLRVTQAVCIAS